MFGKTNLKTQFNKLKDSCKKLEKLPFVDWKSFHDRISNFSESLYNITFGIFEEQEKMKKEIQKVNEELKKTVNEIEKINKDLAGMKKSIGKISNRANSGMGLPRK